MRFLIGVKREVINLAETLLLNHIREEKQLKIGERHVCKDSCVNFHFFIEKAKEIFEK